jgi:spermidine dehydrogenase
VTDRHHRDLGLHRNITRRDFLNGVALGAAGAMLAPRDLLALDRTGAALYPPALTGLRGSHVGSFETAHALRDGGFWRAAGAPVETGESYDLVVVGAGLSGLSAAHFFREAAGPAARILLLDNHDDFGGHAKRNEFTIGGRTLLGYGGTFAIDSAGPYSRVAKGLVKDLGVDVGRWASAVDRRLYPSLGMKRGVFFDRATFGADRLLVAPGDTRRGEDEAENPAERPAFPLEAWRTFLQQAPLSEGARRDILRLHRDAVDHLPGLSSDEKKARLARMSYADFLTKVVGCQADVLPFFQTRPHMLYGLGIDAVPAQDGWGLGFPGFQGMGLDPRPGPGMNLDSVPYGAEEPYFFHFPDGNATLARLLVRRLIPQAIPGRTADDIVTARAEYGRLDEAASPARLRLSSTVVRVRHLGEPATAREVEVAYVREGRLEAVRARRCVLACWSTVIPTICPELPAAQREALAYEMKVPIVYTSVVLRDWKAFVKARVHAIQAPGSYHTSVNLNIPVSVGDYHFAKGPEEPILLHLGRTPCRPGLPAREQHRAGRIELFTTTFETFEREIRGQLAAMLGPAGLDPARDIAGITVNRWPHGYAYQYNSLWDPFWLENGETPCMRARQPFGLLAMANSDTAAYAYTDAAIDQAFRAVQESLPRRG